MTNNSPLYELDTPLAHELAENYILQHDMRTSLATMTLWAEKYAEEYAETEKRLIAQSLFRDAITLFVGCFDKSAQFPLSAQDVYGKYPQGLESFEWFKNTRDAYAAHKFGAQRQCAVGVIIGPQNEIGIGHFLAAYTGQLKSDAPQLLSFMQLAASHLNQKIARLEADFLDSARTVPLEQIKSFRPAAVRPLEQAQSRMSRRDVRKMLSGEPPVAIPDE